MSVSDKHSIKIEYQTSLGEIRASRNTESDIYVELLNSPKDSFQISTLHPTWKHEIVEPTAWGIHEVVLLELITRFRGIRVSSANHSSAFSGELDLVLSRNDDSELLEQGSCPDSNGT
jgi:hypothetical protein